MMESAELRELMDFAVDVARKAGMVARSHYQTDIIAELKADLTPVTVADRETERVARALIRSRYPEDGILGEEFGAEQAGADRRWVLDPIDGTRSFMHGTPLWGVMVALEVNSEPVVGVLHFPVLGDTVYAALGQGCWWNGRPARVSDSTSLADALVLTTDPTTILNGDLGAGWTRLTEIAATARSWGDCYGYAMVATGRAEVMIDPELSHWDVAALIPVVREAGGVITDPSGCDIYPPHGAVATNAALAAEIRNVLKGNR